MSQEQRDLFPSKPPTVTREQIHCSSCNNSLYERDADWSFYKRSFERDYGFLLRTVIPKPHLQAHLELLREKNPAVVIDLFGSRTAMAELGRQYCFQGLKAGIVRWWDHREPNSEEVRKDDEHGITILPGDLRSSESWDRLTSWLGGKKANLILNN